MLSIYITRGCAKGEIIPGISDIDFILITIDESARFSAQRVCATLKVMTAHLIDYYPNLVATREIFEHRWRTSPAWQYRYHEGRKSWKLMYGRDVLSSLPPLTAVQLKSACYLELNRWWLVFAQMLFETQIHRKDVILRNVTCYKVVGELLNVHHALMTGEYRYSRAAAFENQHFPLAEKLKQTARRRFLVDDPCLPEETCIYLLKFFVNMWEGFRDFPFLEILPGVSQEVDSPESEIVVDEGDALHVQAMKDYIVTRLGRKSLGVHVLKSAFWNIEDLLLLVDGKLDDMPTVYELADIVCEHRRVRPKSSHRIYLFLRLGHMAFPITPLLPKDLHRGILTPATIPDVFLQLGESDVYWTNYTRWYINDWRTNEQWSGASTLKQKQLEVIADGVRRGRVVYPLTIKAIERVTIQKTTDRIFSIGDFQ